MRINGAPSPYLFPRGPLERLCKERRRRLRDVPVDLAQLRDAFVPREAVLHEVGDVLLREVVGLDDVGGGGRGRSGGVVLF